MYKFLTGIAIIFFLPITLFGQEFEGVIEYSVDYKSKNEMYSVEFWEKEMGASIITYIKGASYKSITDASFMSMQLFSSGDSLVYYKHQNTDDTIRYRTTNIESDEELDYELIEMADTVLGYPCDKLIVRDRYGTKTYYYSPALYINPDGYRNFTSSNMYETKKIMRSPYLRLYMSYDLVDVDIVAENIIFEAVKEKEFKIPVNSILLREK